MRTGRCWHHSLPSRLTGTFKNNLPQYRFRLEPLVAQHLWLHARWYSFLHVAKEASFSLSQILPFANLFKDGFLWGSGPHISPHHPEGGREGRREEMPLAISPRAGRASLTSLILPGPSERPEPALSWVIQKYSRPSYIKFLWSTKPDGLSRASENLGAERDTGGQRGLH